MLKLEPTEAENVRIPWPGDLDRAWLASLAEELDALTRGGGERLAQGRADEEILRKGLGLSRNDCEALRTAAVALHDRRYGRRGAP
jgi:hypothetical protein